MLWSDRSCAPPSARWRRSAAARRARRRAGAGARQAQALNAFGAVTLARAPDSHFYAEAQVNGASVRFLVDTGATSVVLTGEDARRAGSASGDYSALGMGAGGEIKLMPVQVSRLSLGPVALDNVPVLVAEEGKLPISLLGQSFLARAGNVTIEGDRLTLK